MAMFNARRVLLFCVVLLLPAALLVRGCDDSGAPAAVTGQAGDGSASSPLGTMAPTRRSLAPASHERSELEVAPAERRSEGPLVFSGRVVTEDGGPLGRAVMFIHPPHRSLVAGFATTFTLPSDGAFHVELPRAAYQDAVFLNLVGGGGDTTLYRGLVPARHDVELVVPGPDSEALRSLTGTIELVGCATTKGDLLLLEAETKEPLSFQWGCEGERVPVHLRVLHRPFTKVRGAVLLLLDDDRGLHVQMQYPSIAVLRQRLEAGLEVRTFDTSLIVPDLMGVPVEYVQVAANDNEKIFKRHQVEDGRVSVRGVGGLVRVYGKSDSVGVRGFSRVLLEPGDVVTEWAYVAPGRESHTLFVSSSDDRAVAEAEVVYRLDRPADKGVAPGLFTWSGKSGPDGAVYATGLLRGAYAVTIEHDRYVTRAVRVEVPGQVLRATLSDGRAIAWQFEFPADVAAVERLWIASRGTEEAVWRVEELGVPSRSHDYVQHGVAPGAYEFVAYTQGAVGTLHLEVGSPTEGEGDGPIAAKVTLRAADTLECRVVDVSEQPVSGARVLVRGCGESREAFLQAVTDGDGVVRVPVLPVGEQELCVKDETGRIVAHGALVAGGRVIVQ